MKMRVRGRRTTGTPKQRWMDHNYERGLERKTAVEGRCERLNLMEERCKKNRTHINVGNDK